MTGSLKVWNGVSWEYAQLGQAGVVVQASAPSTPTMGQLWLDSDDTPPGGTYSDTGWIRVLGGVGFLNGWVDFDARTVVYRKINGVVHLQGIAKSGTVGSATPMFVLPAGFRPRAAVTFDYNFIVASNAVPGLLGIVGSTGAVTLQSGSNIYVDLGGVTFPADN